MRIRGHIKGQELNLTLLRPFDLFWLRIRQYPIFEWINVLKPFYFVIQHQMGVLNIWQTFILSENAEASFFSIKVNFKNCVGKLKGHFELHSDKFGYIDFSIVLLLSLDFA
jgi:hypothetical protein